MFNLPSLSEEINQMRWKHFRMGWRRIWQGRFLMATDSVNVAGSRINKWILCLWSIFMQVILMKVELCSDDHIIYGWWNNVFTTTKNLHKNILANFGLVWLPKYIKLIIESIAPGTKLTSMTLHMVSFNWYIENIAFGFSFFVLGQASLLSPKSKPLESPN